MNDLNFALAGAWMHKMNSLPYSVNPMFTKAEEIKRLATEHARCKRWVIFWSGE